MLFPAIISFRLPWGLDTAFVGIGFFHIARIIKELRLEWIFKLNLIQTLVLAIVVSALIMICPIVILRTGIYGWYLPFWINALGGTIAGWNLSRKIEQSLANMKYFNIISKYLAGVGHNSTVYLCLNQTVIIGATKLVSLIGTNVFVEKIVVLIFTMMFLTFLVLEKIICGTKLKIIIGR